MPNNINDIFQNLRNEFVIIGLTGALGSGCTTSANFLSEKHKNLDHFFTSIKADEFSFNYRKSLRVKQFYALNQWKSFYHIRVSDILLLTMFYQIENYNKLPLIKDFDKQNTTKDSINVFFKNIDEKVFDKIKSLSNDFFYILDNSKYEENKLSKILEDTKKIISDNIDKKVNAYTKVFQLMGENIRTSGKIFHSDSQYKYINHIPTFKLKNLPIFILPEILRRTIKLLNKNENIQFFTIDALRNTYEIEFFRNRYQSFYLFSILASEDYRKERLSNEFSVTQTELKEIKEYETSSKQLEHQAINKCIGKGDVFINNDTEDTRHIDLKIELLNYIALIRKPGLFIPSDDERFMQVAFTARYNSGCISRQVGAVVTGEDGYIRGFGWNDVPEGHIPCLYRTPQQLLDGNKKIFSLYENDTIFTEHIEQLSEQVKVFPFCFKDEQNSIENKKDKQKVYDEIKNLSQIKDVNIRDLTNFVDALKIKNPTRERALHAEENAFLQIAKSGGQSVVKGTLYTTDSPCQLCAKKSMQLKIKRIVYIDAYPDISEKHTLNAGQENKVPDFDMFNGVLGAAYFKLYIPIVGIKDENKFI